MSNVKKANTKNAAKSNRECVNCSCGCPANECRCQETSCQCGCSQSAGSR
jgi:hypothetical protein